MMKVENIIEIWEIGGEENKDADRVLKIKSHWNRSGLVCIELAGFSDLTVDAKELQMAIKNAQNFKST